MIQIGNGVGRLAEYPWFLTTATGSDLDAFA